MSDGIAFNNKGTSFSGCGHIFTSVAIDHRVLVLTSRDLDTRGRSIFSMVNKLTEASHLYENSDNDRYLTPDN